MALDEALWSYRPVYSMVLIKRLFLLLWAILNLLCSPIGVKLVFGEPVDFT